MSPATQIANHPAVDPCPTREITITPLDPDEAPVYTGKGPSLTAAVLDLLKQIGPEYDDLAMAKFFEGFHAIYEADAEAKTDFVFEHRDFSCPEDQFNMTFK